MNRLANLILLWSTLVLVGCGGGKPNATKNAPDAQPSPVTDAASKSPTTDATKPTTDAIDRAEIKEHMLEHFVVASELQRAIARGHLDEAQRLAAWLATHEELDLPGWAPYVAAVKAAARDVIAAKDVPSAAAIAPKLALACAACHQAQGAIVAFSWDEAPAASEALPDQMKRHQWAAARLWDGLVGPSDSLWLEGAEVLTTTKLDAAGASNGVPRGDVGALAAKVRELAVKAGTLKTQQERATLYGELLSTCAGCHALVRPTPVP